MEISGLLVNETGHLPLLSLVDLLITGTQSFAKKLLFHSQFIGNIFILSPMFVYSMFLYRTRYLLIL